MHAIKPADRAGEVATTSTPEGPHGGGPCILVLEEDASLRGLLTAALHQEGYEVAPRGAGGPARGVAAPPALVLLDLRRPDAGGLASGVSACGSVAPTVPLLLLSAGCEAERLAAAAALGAAGSLPLPFDLDELLAAVGRLAAPVVVSVSRAGASRAGGGVWRAPRRPEA